MAQLRDEHQGFVAKKTEILVIGPEKKEKFAQYWAKESLPFKGLPDPTLKVLSLFGQEVKLLKLGRIPAQVLVDKQGIVRYAHYGNSMTDIPSNHEIFSLIDELGV